VPFKSLGAVSYSTSIVTRQTDLLQVDQYRASVCRRSIKILNQFETGLANRLRPISVGPTLVGRMTHMTHGWCSECVDARPQPSVNVHQSQNTDINSVTCLRYSKVSARVIRHVGLWATRRVTKQDFGLSDPETRTRAGDSDQYSYLYLSCLTLPAPTLHLLLQ